MELDLRDLNLAEDGAAYRNLADALRDAISRGELSEGRQLPTENELAEHFRLSRQTVRHALQELVSEGLIFRVRGRGTFIAATEEHTGYLRSIGSVEDLLALSREAVWTTIEPLQPGTNIEAASRLRSKSDQIFYGRFTLEFDGQTISASDIYLPREIGRRVVDAGMFTTPGAVLEGTIISCVEETNDAPVTVADQSIVACAMPESYAALVGSRPGDPALRIDRLYYDANGVAVELAVSFFNPDRYTYRVELRRSAVVPTRHQEMLSGRRS